MSREFGQEPIPLPPEEEGEEFVIERFPGAEKPFPKEVPREKAAEISKIETRLVELRTMLQEARTPGEAESTEKEIKRLEQELGGEETSPKEPERELELEESKKEARVKLEGVAARAVDNIGRTWKAWRGTKGIKEAASNLVSEVRAYAQKLGLDAEADQTIIDAVRALASEADAAEIEALLGSLGVKGKAKIEVRD